MRRQGQHVEAEIAASLETLAWAHLETGDREAYGIRLRGLPDDHPEIAESLLEIGRLEASRGEAVARERLERAWCIVRGREAPDDALASSLRDLLAEEGGPATVNCPASHDPRTNAPR